MDDYEKECGVVLVNGDGEQITNIITLDVAETAKLIGCLRTINGSNFEYKTALESKVLKAMAQRKQITVVLPIPHKNLHPNARANWQSVSKATKNARHDSNLATVAEMRANGSVLADYPFGYCSVEARYFFKTRAKRDEDNLSGWLKAYVDGIADAGVVKNDNMLKSPTIVIGYDKIDPRVEITVTELHQ